MQKHNASTIGSFSEEMMSFKVFAARGDSKFHNSDIKRLAGGSSQGTASSQMS